MNYWILQSNPLKFPILDELMLMPDSYWHIDPKKDQKIMEKIQRGDTAFIWKSDGNDEGTRGIYAVATIRSVSPYHKEPYTPGRIDEKEAELGIDWIDKEEGKRRAGWPTVMLEYGKRILHKPLLVDELRAVPNLKDLLIVKPKGFYQRGIYKLTEDQGRTIEKMIESR